MWLSSYENALDSPLTRITYSFLSIQIAQVTL